MFGVFVVMLIMMIRASGRARAWNVVYDTVAKRYKGTLSPANWVARPSIRVPYGQTAAFLNLVKLREGDVTQVQMQWPDRRFRLEVSTDKFTRMPRFRGMTHVELDSEFGSRFQITTSDEDLARKWLSPGVIWQIEQIESFVPPRQVYISINRGMLVVRRLRFLRRVDHLDEYLRFSLELFDQAMLTQSEGIDFVNSEVAQLLEDPRCQVCCEPIDRNIVFCVKCRTAHCEECWKYTGVCSTFACGETRYVRPMVARSLETELTKDRIELDEA